MAENVEIDIVLKIEEAIKSAKDITDSVKEFQKQVQDSVKDAKTFGKDVSSTLDFVKGGFIALGSAAATAVAALATGKIADFFGSAIEKASEQEDAIHELNTALALSGSYSDEASQNFQDFASSLSDTATIGADVILKQAAMAKSLGLTNDQTKEAIKAASELSATFGVSFEDAVTSVSKAYSGQGSALGKLVPAVKGLTEAQLRAGTATQFIIDRFGGAAEAKTQTFSGSVAKLSLGFGNLQESIGMVITQNPVLIAGINEISNIFKIFQASVDQNKEGLTNFITIMVKGVASAAPVMVASFSAVTSSVQFLADSAAILYAGIFRAGEILARMTGNADRANESMKAQDELFQGIVDRQEGFQAVQNVLDDVGVAAANFSISLDQVEKSGNKTQKTTEKYTDKLGDNTDALLAAAEAEKELKAARKKAFEDLKGSIANLQKSLKDVGKTSDEILVDNFNENVRTLRAGLDQGIISFDEFRATVAKLRVDFGEKFNKQIEKIEDADKNIELKVDLDVQNNVIYEEITSAFETGKAIVVDGFNGIFGGGYADQLKSIAEAFNPENLKESLVGLKETLQALVKALPAIFADIISQLPTIIAEMITAFNGFVDIIISEFPKLAEGIAAAAGDFIENLLNQLPRLISAIPKIVRPFIQQIPRIMAALARNIGPIIREVIIAAGEIIADLVGVLDDIIISMANALPGIVTGLVDGIATAMPKIIEAFVNLISEELQTGRIGKALIVGMLLAVRNAFLGMGDILSSLGGSIWNGIKSGFTSSIEGLGTFFAQIGGFIADGFKALFDLGDFQQGITDFFQDVFGNGFEQAFDQLVKTFKEIFTKAFEDINPFDKKGSTSGAGGTPTIAKPVLEKWGVPTDPIGVEKHIPNVFGRSTGGQGMRANSEPRTINIQLMIGHKELASVMLDINKLGLRTV